MTVVISAENLSKSYRLGQIGTGTFTRDLELWLAKLRGKPNPLLKIGETDHDNRDGEDLWALKDVSFKVEQGEVLGIIGKNGAGKSTLLKILSRVTAPTSGEIKRLFPGCRYEFHKITLAPPIARRVVPISWIAALFLENLKIFNTHYLAVIRPR